MQMLNQASEFDHYFSNLREFIFVVRTKIWTMIDTNSFQNSFKLCQFWWITLKPGKLFIDANNKSSHLKKIVNQFFRYFSWRIQCLFLTSASLFGTTPRVTGSSWTHSGLTGIQKKNKNEYLNLWWSFYFIVNFLEENHEFQSDNFYFQNSKKYESLNCDASWLLPVLTLPRSLQEKRERNSEVATYIKYEEGFPFCYDPLLLFFSIF